MAERNIVEERLCCSTELTEALACFIAIGTPPGEYGSADLSHVLDVAHKSART
jgi:UDPglucose 6-dehydrogenase